MVVQCGRNDTGRARRIIGIGNAIVGRDTAWSCLGIPTTIVDRLEVGRHRRYYYRPEVRTQGIDGLRSADPDAVRTLTHGPIYSMFHSIGADRLRTYGVR
ncbi:hypothetical protein BQ8794_140061 [Mesorhizobium prunaredense]|uniref:Uncharacterized protein n=1 Tax=Mesorhizobium prunaredense TaxID=1631249 RepID=A0A1R3V591_9HYPH|nr:hypothetical protein BQ8794_140061 [Mesorhizobium prunaredense]